MGSKHHKLEEIVHIHELRRIEVLVGQGIAPLDAIRQARERRESVCCRRSTWLGPVAAIRRPATGS